MERRIVSLVLNPTNPIRCLQALLHNSDHKILISIPEQISSGWWHWAQPLVFSLPQWRRWDHQWPGAGPVLLLSDWCLWLIHDQLGSPRADAVLYQVGPGNNSWEGATLSRDQAPVSDHTRHKMIFLPQLWESRHYDAWQAIVSWLVPALLSGSDSDLSTLKGADLSALCGMLKTLICLLIRMGLVCGEADWYKDIMMRQSRLIISTITITPHGAILFGFVSISCLDKSKCNFIPPSFTHDCCNLIIKAAQINIWLLQDKFTCRGLILTKSPCLCLFLAISRSPIMTNAPKVLPPL